MFKLPLLLAACLAALDLAACSLPVAPAGYVILPARQGRTACGLSGYRPGYVCCCSRQSGGASLGSYGGYGYGYGYGAHLPLTYATTPSGYGGYGGSYGGYGGSYGGYGHFGGVTAVHAPSSCFYATPGQARTLVATYPISGVGYAGGLYGGVHRFPYTGYHAYQG